MKEIEGWCKENHNIKYIRRFILNGWEIKFYES